MRNNTDDGIIELHNGKRNLRNSLANLNADENVSKKNKKLILKFIRDCELGKTLAGRAKKKIGKLRLARLTNYLKNFAKWMKKDFTDISVKDMEDFILDFENDIVCQKDGRQYKYETKLSYKSAIKKFFRWLHGDGEEFGKLVSWIETYQQLKEISALTRSEVERLVNLAGNIQYKFAIMCLFDSGARAQELYNVRLKHITRKKDYYMMRISHSKTKPRTISLPMCTELMDEWLKKHPDKDNPEALLIQRSYGALRLFLRRHGQEILGKNVTPHLLRHSSASYYCNKLTQYQLCYRYGWSMASDMPARYIDREGIHEMETAKIVKQDDMAAIRESYKDLKEELIRQKETLERINKFVPFAIKELNIVPGDAKK